MIPTIKKCILQEASSLQAVADQIDETSYLSFLHELEACKGHIIFTGVGKSGIVAKKIASSFCSLGIHSIYLDVLAMLHGDLGTVADNDLCVILSNSGETDIVLELVRHLTKLGIPILSITGNADSSLSSMSKHYISFSTNEAGPFGIVPSTSCIAMMAIGDGLLCALSERKKISKEALLLYHPCGDIPSCL